MRAVGWGRLVGADAVLARRRAALEDAHEAAGADLEQKVGRRERLDPLIVALVAHETWGRSLTEEWDRRVAADAPADTSRRAMQALRGHVTRTLFQELGERLDTQAASGGSDSRAVPAIPTKRRSGRSRVTRSARTTIGAPALTAKPDGAPPSSAPSHEFGPRSLARASRSASTRPTIWRGRRSTSARARRTAHASRAFCRRSAIASWTKSRRPRSNVSSSRCARACARCRPPASIARGICSPACSSAPYASASRPSTP